MYFGSTDLRVITWKATVLAGLEVVEPASYEVLYYLTKTKATWRQWNGLSLIWCDVD